MEIPSWLYQSKLFYSFILNKDGLISSANKLASVDFGLSQSPKEKRKFEDFFNEPDVQKIKSGLKDVFFTSNLNLTLKPGHFHNLPFSGPIEWEFSVDPTTKEKDPFVLVVGQKPEVGDSSSINPNLVFQEMVESIAGLVWQYQLFPDGRDKINFISPGCLNLLEVTQTEVYENIGLLWSLIPKEEVTGLKSSILESYKNLTPWFYEHPVVLRSGEKKWVQGSGIPRKLEDGSVTWNSMYVDVSSKHQIKDQLFESQERFANLAEKVPSAIWLFIQDPEGKQGIVYLNQKCEELWEVDKETAESNIMSLWGQSIEGEAERVYWKGQESAKNMTDWSDEWKMLSPSGNYKWIQASGKPSKMQDGSIHWYVVATDVTDRKLADISIEDKGTRLANVIEATNAGTWEWNIVSGDLILNSRWAEMMGYSLEEIGPHTIETWALFVHPEDRIRIENLLQEHFSGKIDLVECEVRFRHKSGHWIWVFKKARVIEWKAPGQPLRMAGIHLDITKLKEIEIEVETQRDRLENILFATNTGTWEWDLEQDTIVFNSIMAGILGFEKEEFKERKFDQWMELLHPDDFLRENNILKKLISKEVSDYESEVRKKTREGTWKWCLSKAKVTKQDKDGKPLLVSGTCQDIQERKLGEKELWMARFSTEMSADSIYWIQPDGKIFNVNKAACDMLGYSKEELTSLFVYEITQSYSKESWAPRFEQIRDLKVEKLESGRIAKNGRIIPVEITANYINLDGEEYVFSIVRDITNRKRLEEEVRKLSLVARKTSNAVVITDEKRKIIWVNEAFQTITGYDFQDAIGKHPGQLLQSEDSDPETIELMRRQLGAGLPVRCEIINRNKKGKNYWIDLDIQPLMDADGKLSGFIAVQSDITAAKVNSQKLKDSEARLMANLKNTPNVAVQWYHENGDIFFWNPASESLFGWTAAEALGKNYQEVFQPSDGGREFLEIIQKVKATGSPYGPAEIPIKTKSGQELILFSTLFSFPVGQGNMGYVCMDVDITFQKRAEESILKILNAKTLQNNRLKDFSFMTSHNLRASVANLMGMFEIMEDQIPDYELIPMVRSTVEKLDTTIRSMNTLIQLEEEGQSLELVDCFPKSIVERILELNNQMIQTLGAEFKVDIDPILCLKGNPAYLESVFHNLISNALKYGISDKSKKIEIFAFKENEKVSLVFKDYGLGMNVEKIKTRIFKPGSRFHPENPEGQGLGLFMVKRQIELLGGSIDYMSKLNFGTTFTITLNA